MEIRWQYTFLYQNVQLVKRPAEDGTAIGDALALAAARLKTAEDTLAVGALKKESKYEIKAKVIILLTDGENNAGKRTPIEAAKLAKKCVAFFCVSVMLCPFRYGYIPRGVIAKTCRYRF